jgi:rubrerythrin
MSRADFVRGQLSDITPQQAISALNNRWALAAPGDFANDVDVLNFALTLEYLEAAFYQQGNAAGLVSGTEATYLTAIGNDEQAHVDALTATIKQLGGTPVAKPGVAFGDAFASRDSYLTTSVTFENVGVGAYLGAAGYIKDKSVLQAAAGIFGVEARHAAIVANLLGQKAEGGVYHSAFETPMPKADVLTAVSPFLMSQMGTVPTGSVDTGGGSASSSSNTGLYALGGAAVLGAAGIATYAATRRSAVGAPPQSADRSDQH